MSLDYIDEYWFNPFKKNKEAKMTQEQDEKEGKMDEKIGEIEDCLSKILYDEKDYGGKQLLKDETAWLAYYKLVKNSELWLRHLLSCIKKLEEKVELAEATRGDALAYAKMFREQVKGLGEEKSKMVKLSPENMKKLGWSYT